MKYRLGNQNYYRKGVLYAAGSVIDLPDDEVPSITWTKVKDQSLRPDREVEMHPGEPKEDDPALQPLPDTPPTAKSVAGFIPNSTREADEEPAISREERLAKKEAAKKEVVVTVKSAADAKVESHHDKKHTRHSDKGPFGETK